MNFKYVVKITGGLTSTEDRVQCGGRGEVGTDSFEPSDETSAQNVITPASYSKASVFKYLLRERISYTD
jgi:hypothetical protein